MVSRGVIVVDDVYVLCPGVVVDDVLGIMAQLASLLIKRFCKLRTRTMSALLSLQPSNSASELIVDGWFYEEESMLPGDNIRTTNRTEDWADLYSGDLPAGQKFGLKVESVIANGRSEFQVTFCLSLYIIAVLTLSLGYFSF